MRFKSAYTTGEAARICQLSQTTIIRLFDAGVIVGFRVPGSRFRRIPHEELDRFLTEHSLPNPLAAARPAPTISSGERRDAARELGSTIESQVRTIAAHTSTLVGFFNEPPRDGA